MFDIFNKSGVKMTEFLKTEVENGSTDIDMKDAFGRYTMDVIASAAFGVESQVFKDKDSPFALSGKKLQNQFKGFKVWKLIIAIFAPKLLSFFKIKFRDEEAHAFFENVIRETINRRENSSEEKRADFLQLLLDARGGKELADESGEKLDTFEKDAQLTKATKMQLTDNLIYAQALLFFIAGFDTTESLLIFAAYELALNQDVQEKLFQEIDQVVERDEKMNYETVNHMEYLEKVVSETLRKYPPGFRTERKCTMEYKIPNSIVTLVKDAVVMIPIIGIHHDEKYFPEPEKFDPERFSPENKEKRHPYAYMPFGTGPRNCIAMRFALMEGKACLAHLFHKFKIEPSSKTMIPLKYSKSAAFKPEGGMWLKITPRS
jgi:cytochrome P450